MVAPAPIRTGAGALFGPEGPLCGEVFCLGRWNGETLFRSAMGVAAEAGVTFRLGYVCTNAGFSLEPVVRVATGDASALNIEVVGVVADVLFARITKGGICRNFHFHIFRILRLGILFSADCPPVPAAELRVYWQSLTENCPPGPEIRPQLRRPGACTDNKPRTPLRSKPWGPRPDARECSGSRRRDIAGVFSRRA